MKRATSGVLKGRLLATSALVATALLISPVARAGGPSGGSVAVGSATISAPNANQTVVNQSTNKALINWDSFSIPNGSSVVFNQPTANSLTVNRVTGPSASVIDGQMLANGNIWLLNSNGVLFGHGAQVNVGGLLATTSDITDDDFKNGHYRFSKPSANDKAAVVNQGTITAAKGGSVVLSAQQVSNEGVIRADLGSVVLGGARTFTVDLDGDNLIRYQIGKPVAETPKDASGKAAPALVSNSGTISADGGSVLITARAVRNIENNVINNTGIVEANSVSTHNGEIVFDAGPDGTVNAGGSISASGRGQGETGGSVSVTGGTVNVTDGAKVDASGDQGGGTVQIGGGLHGQGSIANAQSVNVGKASISADAVTQGDGGKISVWSDGQTAFSGSASAKGGAQGGNGGIVETSGEQLNVGSDAKVDTSAAQGDTGTWLLDPTDIDIVNGGADGIGGSNIAPSTITSALTSTNVSLQATNDITVDSNISYSSANSLTLIAGHDIAFNASIQNSGNGGVVLSAHSIGRSGNVSITAKSADITVAGDGSDGASIGTSANPLQLNVQSLGLHTGGANAYIASLASTIALGASDLGTGDLTINPSGSVTQTAAIHLDALNITTLPGSVTLTNTGNTFNSLSLGLTGGSANIYDASALTVTSALIGSDLTLSSGGAITQTGVIHASGLTVSSTGGAINLTNTGNTFALLTVTTSGAYDASLYDASAMTVASANVGGELTLSGSSSVRQNGAIHAAALSASSTGGAITLTHSGNTFGDVSLSTTGSLSASIYDSVAMNIAAATVGGDLTLSGGGAITQSGALHANALTVTTTNGAITLSNAGNTFNTATVTTAGTDDATLADASTLTVASATVGGDLTLAGGNNIVQSGAIHAATLSASTTGGSITLTNASNSFATAALAATGDATVYQAAALVIASADVDGTLTLSSGSTIGQTGAIQAGTLDATTTNGAITLSNSGNSIGTVNLSTSGTDGATLYDASALTVASATIGGDLILTGSSIGQSGAIHTHKLNVSATGGSIALTNAGNTFDTLTVATSGAGNASLYDSQSLSVTSANVGGALTLSSAGAIGQTGAIHAASLNATTANGAIVLANTGNSFAAASLATSGADNATLYDQAALTITGATVGGNLSLSGGGNIGQSGAIHTHALSVTTSSGSITLANAANTFDTTTLTASGEATLRDASALSVTSANIGGDLTLTGGASITQTGAIHSGALNASTTGGPISLTNTGNTFGTANVGTSGSYDATLYDASSFVVTGANVGGTLTLKGGGSIGQSGAIVANALAVTTTNGAIDLGNAGNAFATATLSTSGTDDATLYDASALTIVSANIGGDLALSGGASITQTGAIHSATLNVSSTGGPVSLTNTGNDFGPVYVATGGANDAALYNGPDLTLTGANVGGTLTLSSGGAIGQTGAIHAAALNASTTAGAITLTNSGNSFGTVTLATSGSDDASIYDATNLIVASANIGGDLTLSVAGSLGQTGAIHAASLNATTTGGAINLTNAGNSFAVATLATSGSDNASLYDAANLTVASANVGGTLTLTGGGTINQSGAIHAASLVATTTHGAITLTNAGNTVGTATLSTSGSDNASFTDASNLIVASANVGGTLTLSGSGSIGQSGAIHAAALNVSTTGGDITLTNTGNAFNTASLATAGSDDASLYDSQALTIASANIGGDLSLSGASSISQTGAIHAATLNVATTGGAIVLTNSGNNFGPLTVSTSGSDNATLYDAIDLIVANANVGGTLTLSSGGAISQTGAIHASDLNAATTNGAITLTNAGNAFDTATLSTSGSDDASVYDSQALTIASANIGGDLSLSGGDSIGQTGAIHAATLNVTTTNGAVVLTNSGNSFGPVTISTAGSDDATLYDAIDLNIAGADIGGTLTLSSGGNIFQTGAIHAGGLNASTTNGAITLINSGNAFDQVVLATSGSDDASLYDSRALIVASANIGGTLNLSGAGTIGQSGAIHAAVLNVTTTGGAITLTNSGNSFAAASLATGGTDDASLYDASDLTVTGADVGGTLNLSGGGAIAQSGAIQADALNVTAAGSIALANTGNMFATASLSTPEDATLYDASNLTVTSATVGGALTLSGGGSISQSGAIQADALSVTTTNGAIALTNAGNAFNVATLATSGTDDASLYDSLALTVAGANVGGNLSLSAAGSIGQTGAIHAATLNVATTGGAITLTNSGNSFGPATISTAGSDNASLYDAANLTVASANVGGTLTLTGGGAINQSGAIHAASLVATTTHGAITLTNAGNTVGTATLSTSGSDNASFTDASNLIVASANVGGTLTLSGSGSIGQSGAIHAAALNVSTTGGDITLTNTGNAFNTASLATAGSDDATIYDANALTISSANIGGTFNLSGAGAIGQSGAIHSAVLNVTTTGGNIALTNSGNNFATASLSTANDASLYDSTDLTISSANVGGTLTLSGGGAIGQTGAIQAGILNVSALGAITLANTGNSFGTASVSTGNDATLYDSSALVLAGADVDGTLTLTVEGPLSQSGAIHAHALIATTTAGAVDLTHAGNTIDIANLTTSGTDDASLHDASALSMSGANVGGTLALSGDAGITQTGAIHADALDVSTTAGDIVLTDTGNTFHTASVATSGANGATLYDTASLTITGADVGGALGLTSGGSIGQTGAIHAASLNVTATGGDIALSNAGNAFAAAALTTSGDATLYDASALTISGADVGGTLTLSGGASIGQSDAIHAGALNVSTTHGAIDLSNTGNSFAIATLATAGTDDATLYDAAALTVSSATIGGNLSLSSGGSIGQSGAIHAKSLTVSSTGGAIALTNAGNAFDTLSVTTGGTNSASFTDSSNLTVASADVGGTLLITANAIGQSGAIHAAALNVTATNGAIALTNSGNSFANAALTTSGNNNASLYDASALVIDGANVGGTLALSAGGAISQIDAIHANVLSVTTTSGQISLTSANNAVNSASLSTPGSAWFYDGSSLTLTGANVGGSLTVLSKHDLLFVSSAQAKTGLLAVAGWDGTTVDPAALVAGTAYANNGGNITIGGASAPGDVAVGSQNGTTTLAANNVTLAATNGYAQIGYHGAGTDAISVYAKGDLTLSGGAQAARFAQIGNGGYQVSGNQTGNIYISAAGNLALNAGSGQAAYAQIGHGGAQSNSSSQGYSDTGLITISAKTAKVAAGSGTAAYAQIGHGGYLSGQSLLGGTATLGGDITVATVSGIALTGNGTAAYAQIGHGGDLVNNNAANGTSGTISGNITASVSTKPSDPSIDPVTAIAGSGDESYAQIGNGGSGENTPVSQSTVNFTISGNLFVDDITLRGSNTGARGYAQIGNGDAGRNGTGNVSGDITIGNGFHVDALGGTANNTAALIGNDTGFGTVTGLVTFLSNPNPPPPPPPPPPTVGSSGGAIAVVIQKPTENIGNVIVVVTVPVVNLPDSGSSGSSGHGPGPLEQLVDGNSDGKSSEGEQASDSASESLGKSLDAGRRSASQELMPGLTRNMGQHPHAVPPADVDYSSWGNEAFWLW